jgi:DNA-binding NarL/FixJ family response regulator
LKTKPATRVLLVDDQLLFVESLKYVIEARAEDIEVVGLASDGAEAMRLVAELEPHVVMMDVRMPGMDGVEATRRIHRRWPQVAIVMLTTFKDDEYVHFAMKYGAVGYLLKNIPPSELIEALRGVRRGRRPVAPSVVEILRGTRGSASELSEREHLVQALSRREKDVLQLMLRAYDNRQIAEALNVAEQTVRNYISTIYSKLGVSSRMQLIQMMDEIEFMLSHID